MEDTLFAGAVIARIKDHFSMNCDSSQIAQTLYKGAKDDLYGFMKEHDASHYHRLTNYGLEKDIRHCLTPDLANILPYYRDERLVIQ
jgi:2-phosphosulfolactate phosphatase